MKRTVRHFLRGDAQDVKLYELDTDALGVVDGDGYQVKERLFGWRGFGVVSSWRDRRRRSSRDAARKPGGTSRVESLRGLSVTSLDDARLK